MTQVTAIIQARMGSTRCPGKVLRPLAGVPLIEHLLNRLRTVPDFDQIVLAIPNAPSEEPLVKAARRLGTPVFQGPEDDVLLRFVLAGDQVGAENIVRVCADNPLIDPYLASTLVQQHLEKKADYTLPADPIPLGTGVEVVRFHALRQIADKTTAPRYREHVTTYFQDHPESYRQLAVPAPAYLRGKSYRLTVDTDQDFILMEQLYQTHFNPAHPTIDLQKVIQYLDTHPEVAHLNADVPQKNWRLNGK